MTVGKVGALLGGVLLVGMIGAFAFGLPAGGHAALDAGGFSIQVPTVFDVQGDGGYIVLAAPDKAVGSESLLVEKLLETRYGVVNEAYGSCSGL